MAKRTKQSPSGAPLARVDAGAADPAHPRLIMVVDGGPRGEEYRFHFEASAAGAIRCRFKSELSSSEARDLARQISLEEFDRLLRGVDVAGLKEARRRKMPPIPPCSVVGQLEVFDGREQVKVLFMAEPEQAKQAGYRMPPAVARATQRVYALAAEQLGLKSGAAVRPAGS